MCNIKDFNSISYRDFDLLFFYSLFKYFTKIPQYKDIIEHGSYLSPIPHQNYRVHSSFKSNNTDILETTDYPAFNTIEMIMICVLDKL